MRFINTVLVLLVCSSKTLGQGYNYPAPSTNDGTTPENMFLSTPTSPSFSYSNRVKDPQRYNFGSDDTTPQYGGNNQRSGDTNQPQEGYSGSNNFAPRSQPSRSSMGIKSSNGYSTTNSLTGARITNGYQNSGFNQPTEQDSDSRNAQSGFEGNNKQEGGNFEDIAGEEGDYSAIPGQPDIDYPILSSIPDTSFQCSQQEFPGYYADVETRCQVFHVCANSKSYDFLCPNGTVFHQEFLVCVWWNLFDCSLAPSFYGVNANLYVSQDGNDNILNTDNQGLRGINDSPTGPGSNNPENNGYHSGEPVQPQESNRPSLSPQVPRFPPKQEINTQKPNGISQYLPPQNQQLGTGNLPLNNQNSFNQKPSNGYNQSNNNKMRKINSTSKLDGEEGYNYGNQKQEGVNEEQPYYQSNQMDRNNDFQSPQANQNQGSKQNRGYLPPVALI